MKAILEFSLPDERKEHLRAVKATDMAIALFDIIYNARKRVENEVETLPSSNSGDVTFEVIFDIIRENNINIDELID